ncbi:tetratricopeptide repeat protein [Bremerella cremea]|uniref:tetratricopeptide repeat protein n=1 Tax=Bremerella cremea TaxID=1031537 RepID=UPI0031EF3543
MRTLTYLVGLTILAVATTAQAQGLGQYQYKSRGNISVGRGGYADVTSPGWSGSHHSGGNHGGHHYHHGGGGNWGGNWGGNYPYYGGNWYGAGLSIGVLPPPYGYVNPYAYPFAYGGGYSTIYPYGTYYRPGDQYLEYYLPPTEPAELNYGPQAMKQFMGLPRDFAIQPQRTGTFDSIVTPLPTSSTVESAKPVVIEQPSPQAIQRAAHFIESGDNLFAQQRYQEALGRYKDAIAAAPGFAEAYLRKGLAYLATNRPDEAVEAIERAIQQDPKVVDTSLTLQGMLGNNGLAKSSIIEANARRAVTDPENPKYLFCVAVLLFFDGDDEQATKVFAACQRAGGDPQFIQPFALQLNKTVTTVEGLDL